MAPDENTTSQPADRQPFYQAFPDRSPPPIFIPQGAPAGHDNYSEENLPTRADTGSKGITRVPATLTAAQAALAQAEPAGMGPLTDGYRSHVRSSTYGGVVQR